MNETRRGTLFCPFPSQSGIRAPFPTLEEQKRPLAGLDKQTSSPKGEPPREQNKLGKQHTKKAVNFTKSLSASGNVLRKTGITRNLILESKKRDARRQRVMDEGFTGTSYQGQSG